MGKQKIGSLDRFRSRWYDKGGSGYWYDAKKNEVHYVPTSVFSVPGSKFVTVVMPVLVLIVGSPQDTLVKIETPIGLVELIAISVERVDAATIRFGFQKAVPELLDGTSILTTSPFTCLMATDYSARIGMTFSPVLPVPPT